MLKVCLIRHSVTEGNLHNRYIGITDEQLCDKGRALLLDYPKIKTQRLIVSPLKRCLETAKIIFGNMEYVVNEDLRECDFGEFENKNYIELEGNVNYQKWIDSNGKLPFPGGEAHENFVRRCVDGFVKEVDCAIKDGIDTMAFVVHGGTIMSIMQYLNHEEDFYKYHVKNAEGYELFIDKEKWQKNEEKLKEYKKIGKEI